jgi:molybdenum cofactor cytidylyltransferase
MCVAAIVLTAGRSARMGAFKPLLDFDGRPMIARVVECLRASGVVSPILVVTGHRAGDVAGALRGEADVTIVHNPDHAVGEMLSSVQAGVRALPAGTGAFVLAHGDQPAVRPDTIRRVIDLLDQPNVCIGNPEYAGGHGHPVVMSAVLVPAILALPAGATLKELVHARAAGRRHAPVDDPAVLADVDTPADYARALALWREQQARFVPQAPHAEPTTTEGATHAP